MVAVVAYVCGSCGQSKLATCNTFVGVLSRILYTSPCNYTASINRVPQVQARVCPVVQLPAQYREILTILIITLHNSREHCLPLLYLGYYKLCPSLQQCKAW